MSGRCRMKGLEAVKAVIAKYKGLIILNSVLLIYIMMMIWIKPVDSLRKYDIYNHSGETEDVLMPVYGDISVSQYFTCSEPSDSFEIYVLPVNDEYHGVFAVRLFDENDDLVEQWITDKLDTADGWVQYRLKNHILDAGNSYRIEVSASESDEFGALGVACFDAAAKASGAGGLIYDPEEGSNDLYSDKTLSFGVYMHRINVFAILAFVCLFAAVNFCWIMKDKGTAWLSVSIVLAAGLIMMIILAPGCGPDDRYHYYSSMVLSNKILARDNINEIEKKYESNLPIHHNTNTALMQTYEGLRYRVGGEDGTYIIEGSRDKLKWPLSHLAQAVGITVGRLLRLGFIRVYTMGRLFNLAAYTALAVLAVRLVPIDKELMLMMAILPMTMQQATQLSYDMPVNGLALVFIGYLFRILYEKKQFGWKNTVICALLLTAIGPLKVIYVLLGLLLLIIPQSRFKSVADRLIKIGVQAACCVISLLIARGRDMSANMVRYSAETVGDAGVQEVRNYTIQFLLSEPVRFVRFIISNSESHLSNMIKGMIGGSLAGFALNIPEQLILLFALCLLFCALAEKEPLIEKGWQTAVILVTVLLGYFAMLTVFAFAETIYGIPYIGGTQGRYLIPFLFPAMYCLCGRRIGISLNRLSLFIPLAFIEAGYIVEVMSNIDF